MGCVERPADDLVLLGDNLDVLPRFADESFQLVYADPPFNTGGKVRRRTLEIVPDEASPPTATSPDHVGSPSAPSAGS